MTVDPNDGPQPVGTLWLVDLSNGQFGIWNAGSAGDSAFPASQSAIRNSQSAIREVGPESAGPLARAMGFDDAEPVLERFGGGRRCYAAFVEGVLVSYGWVSMEEEWVSELGLHIRLAPGNAYIWDCATLPEYRGRGLYPALLVYILGDLQEKGVRRVWIGADTGSVASQKGIVRAGFQPIADFFPSPARSATRFYVEGRPGAPEELVRAAHDAFLAEP